MSCVSRAELQRFVSGRVAPEAFVAHVDACADCAAALAALARGALAAPAVERFPAEAWLVALALAVAVMAWPRPVLQPGEGTLEAGVPEAAAWQAPAPPPTVASLDGGGIPRPAVSP